MLEAAGQNTMLADIRPSTRSAQNCLTGPLSAERLTFQRAMTKPSGILCLKTGLEASNHIEISFFVVKFTFPAEYPLLFDFISRKFAHFAEAFELLVSQTELHLAWH